MNLDRFAYGLPDKQDCCVIDYCSVCNEPMFDTDKYDYDSIGNLKHEECYEDGT